MQTSSPAESVSGKSSSNTSPSTSSSKSSNSRSTYEPLPSYCIDVCQRLVARKRIRDQPLSNLGSYSQNTTVLCDSILSGDITAPLNNYPQFLCGKLSPVLCNTTTDPRFNTKDWFSHQPELVAAYPVLGLFRRIAVHDLNMSCLYKRMAEVQYKMAALYKRMATYNRRVNRNRLGFKIEDPGRKKLSCQEELDKLEKVEDALDKEEEEMTAKEMKLFEEECRCFIEAHEAPEKEELILKCQQARRFAELERQAAYVDRAYACHQRLTHSDDYEITVKETTLMNRKINLERKEQRLDDREKRLNNQFLAICQDLYRRYMIKYNNVSKKN